MTTLNKRTSSSSSLLTLSYTAHQYNKYKQYTRTGRLTGECGRSVHTMISTSNLH